MSTVHLIAAVARNGVIGDGTTMPWHVPDDLHFFKRTTMGHPMLMGRRTFETMGVLPGRRSVVITRQPRWSHDGVEVAHSLEQALHLTRDVETVFVVGGGEIYQAAMPHADRLLITHLDLDAEGSVTFPPIDPEVWTATHRVAGDGLAWVTYDHRV